MKMEVLHEKGIIETGIDVKTHHLELTQTV